MKTLCGDTISFLFSTISNFLHEWIFMKLCVEATSPSQNMALLLKD